MLSKIDKIQLAKQFKQSIHMLESQQEELYHRCLHKFGISPDKEPEATILFDWLYNDTDESATSVLERTGCLASDATKPSETKVGP